MIIIASILFLTVIILSLLTITASFKSSMPRIIEIVEDRKIRTFTSPTIRIGNIKHYKIETSAEIKETSQNIVELPLNLTHKLDDIELPQAA